MEQNNRSLEDLMLAAQQGDNYAYHQLLVKTSEIIRRYLYKQLILHADIEDIVQETLFAIHKASHTYQPNRPLTPWIYAITKYKVNDYLRKLYRRKDSEVIDFDSIAECFSSDVTKTVDDDEYIDKLLGLLPDKQRRIVEMMKIEGFSAQEVADQMQMKLSAVKVSAHRAYRFLLKELQKGEL